MRMRMRMRMRIMIKMMMIIFFEKKLFHDHGMSMPTREK